MTLIYLPFQKTMFTGDMVNNHMHPFFAGAVSPENRSHISEWIKQIVIELPQYIQVIS
jgi:hypothetical protein